MSEFCARPNWQARVLTASYLQRQVESAVQCFNRTLQAWQQEGESGGFPFDEDFSPLSELVEDLNKLRQVEELVFWSDSAEAYKAVDSFRRQLEEVVTDD